MKALKRLCQVNACQLLFVASVKHVTGAGMSNILWLTELCPPVLPCAWSSSYCILPLLHRLWAKKHLCAAGTEGTYRSCQCLLLNISSVIPCLQLYTHARSPSLSCLELVEGFCPCCKHTWRVYFICQRSDLSGFRLGGLVSKPGSLRRVGNDLLIKFLICMLIAVQLKIILF